MGQYLSQQAVHNSQSIVLGRGFECPTKFRQRSQEQKCQFGYSNWPAPAAQTPIPVLWQNALSLLVAKPPVCRYPLLPG